MSKRGLEAARRFKNRWHWKYKRHIFHPVDWNDAALWKREAQEMAWRQTADLYEYGRSNGRRRWRLSVSKTRVHWQRYLRLKENNHGSS